jgi:hypothetical protein
VLGIEMVQLYCPGGTWSLIGASCGCYMSTDTLLEDFLTYITGDEISNEEWERLEGVLGEPKVLLLEQVVGVVNIKRLDSQQHHHHPRYLLDIRNSRVPRPPRLSDTLPTQFILNNELGDNCHVSAKLCRVVASGGTVGFSVLHTADGIRKI